MRRRARIVFAAAFAALVFLAGLSQGAIAQDTRSARDPLETEAQFLTGLEALETGRARAAIPIFQQILAQDPGLTRVRLELARAYFLTEQWQRARREFFTALSSDLPPPVRDRVLRFIRLIDARRGFDWDLGIALAQLGDTRRFRSDTLDLRFGAFDLPFRVSRDDRTELGLQLTGAANLRRRLGQSGRGSITAFGGVFFDIDAARDKRLRDATVGLRAGARATTLRSTYSLAAVVDRRDLQDRRWEETAGLEAVFEHRTAAGLSFFGRLSGSEVNNLRLDDLDGREVAWQLGSARAVGGRGLLGLGIFGEIREVEAGFQGYRTHGLRVFGEFNARFGLSLSSELAWSRKEFSKINPLFTRNPDENRWNATLRIEKSDVFLAGGFSPFAAVEHERVDSGIDAFSYTDTAFQIGVERQF